MAEPIDLIFPILQRLQADLGELKRDLGDMKRELGGKIDGLRERMEAFEGYFTYTMGLTSRNKADIDAINADFLEMKRRLEALENKPQ